MQVLCKLKLFAKKDPPPSNFNRINPQVFKRLISKHQRNPRVFLRRMSLEKRIFRCVGRHEPTARFCIASLRIHPLITDHLGQTNEISFLFFFSSLQVCNPQRVCHGGIGDRGLSRLKEQENRIQEL